MHLEEVLARYPAVLLSLLPRSTILSDANDDIQAVVTEIQALAMTLRAISDQCKSIVLEIILEMGVSTSITQSRAVV